MLWAEKTARNRKKQQMLQSKEVVIICCGQRKQPEIEKTADISV